MNGKSWEFLGIPKKLGIIFARVAGYSRISKSMCPLKQTPCRVFHGSGEQAALESDNDNDNEFI